MASASGSPPPAARRRLLRLGGGLLLALSLLLGWVAVFSGHGKTGQQQEQEQGEAASAPVAPATQTFAVPETEPAASSPAAPIPGAVADGPGTGPVSNPTTPASANKGATYPKGPTVIAGAAPSAALLSSLADKTAAGVVDGLAGATTDKGEEAGGGFLSIKGCTPNDAVQLRRLVGGGTLKNEEWRAGNPL